MGHDSFAEVSFPTHAESRKDSFQMDLSLMSSATLARLAEEVKNEELTANRYDRMHNRHNR
jgi:hypothetical protein